MKNSLRSEGLSNVLSMSALLTVVSTTSAAFADIDLVFVSDFYQSGGAYSEVAQFVKDLTEDPYYTVTDVLATEVSNGSGEVDEYTNVISPLWNDFYGITHAVPGNHDYAAGDAGFMSYFGNATYHAFTRTVGETTWKIIGLDSNQPTDPTQLSWLDGELSGQTCTIVYAHHPRWSSGSHGSNSNMDTIWRKLAANNVELFLAGHSHDFERFWPKDANGNWDYGVDGVVQVVAGVGGAARTATSSIVDGSIQIFATDTSPASEPGVLVLHLYDFMPMYLGMYYSATTGELLHYWWNNCY